MKNLNSTLTSQLSHWSIYSWRNEKFENICKLNAFCSLIENLLSFTCYVQAFNTNYLQQRYQDIKHGHNLSSNDMQKFINTSKYSYISIWWPWFDGDVQHANALTFLWQNTL
jgi:hypothetical protein